MFLISRMFHYSIKKRKKSLLSALGCIILVYTGIQFIYMNDEYSPLQLLSSVESEANRLLRYITQIQVNCNNSLATSNASLWLLCQEPELGLPADLSSTKGIVYSLSPSSDYSFEQVIGKNSSYKLLIFSHDVKRLENLQPSNSTSVYKSVVVPNDPADFARDSFQTRTLNSIAASFKHKEIEILKIDTLPEAGHTCETLHFLIEDSFLARVKELHIVLELDKVEEDFIYNWYRVLYALFHESGFRLYHTAASNPLCLQDTIMESCKYFLSWIKSPPPHIFVMYPPAIDGSLEHEEERIVYFLDESSSTNAKVETVVVETTPMLSFPQASKAADTSSMEERILPLAQKIFNSNTHSCTFLFILKSSNKHFIQWTVKKHPHCRVVSLIPTDNNHMFLLSSSSMSPNRNHIENVHYMSIADIFGLLKQTETNALHIDSENSWDVLQLLLNSEIPKKVDQLIFTSSIFGKSDRRQAFVLRKNYSLLKQVEGHGFTLVSYEKHRSRVLRYGEENSLDFNFVKSLHL